MQHASLRSSKNNIFVTVSEYCAVGYSLLFCRFALFSIIAEDIRQIVFSFGIAGSRFKALNFVQLAGNRNGKLIFAGRQSKAKHFVKLKLFPFVSYRLTKVAAVSTAAKQFPQFHL